MERIGSRPNFLSIDTTLYDKYDKTSQSFSFKRVRYLYYQLWSKVFISASTIVLLAIVWKDFVIVIHEKDFNVPLQLFCLSVLAENPFISKMDCVHDIFCHCTFAIFIHKIYNT